VRIGYVNLYSKAHSLVNVAIELWGEFFIFYFLFFWGRIKNLLTHFINCYEFFKNVRSVCFVSNFINKLCVSHVIINKLFTFYMLIKKLCVSHLLKDALQIYR
jgi:hypothetical protein